MSLVSTQQKEAEFARDLVTWDWTRLRQAPDLDAMASELERAIAALTERHFPLVRVRKRSNEDPWITRSIRRLGKKKIRQYKKGGKTPKWWDIDRKLQEAIAAAKDDYVARLLLDGNNGRPFYAATQKLSSATSSAPWSVTDLYIGKRPAEVCNEVLGFFSGIAGSEAPPMPDIPRVCGGLGPFSQERTAKVLKAAKKTDSMVPGDPLPHLIRTFPQEFAVPVSEIYNKINETGRWPSQW